MNGGRPIAWFERRNDPSSLCFADGFAPDFARVVDVARSASRMYGGAIRKLRILSKNRRVQYQFVAGPRHVWIIPAQALTTELSSYGARTIDVIADEDLFVPGYEYHYLERGELYTQIPRGLRGPGQRRGSDARGRLALARAPAGDPGVQAPDPGPAEVVSGRPGRDCRRPRLASRREGGESTGCGRTCVPSLLRLVLAFEGAVVWGRWTPARRADLFRPRACDRAGADCLPRSGTATVVSIRASSQASNARGPTSDGGQKHRDNQDGCDRI